jgi:hypothetical protein
MSAALKEHKVSMKIVCFVPDRPSALRPDPARIYRHSLVIQICIIVQAINVSCPKHTWPKLFISSVNFSIYRQHYTTGPKIHNIHLDWISFFVIFYSSVLEYKKKDSPLELIKYLSGAQEQVSLNIMYT